MLRKGFTLIELLVVIAIIAILAAILFPVFAQAKKAAKKTTALTHMKEIGTGIQLYISDYDDTFSPGYYYNNPCGTNNNCAAPTNLDATGIQQWSGITQPYIKNYQMFIDPGDPTGGLVPTNFNDVPADGPINLGAGLSSGATSFTTGTGLQDNQAPRLSFTANEALMPRPRGGIGGVQIGQQQNVVSSTGVDSVAGTILIAQFSDYPNSVSGTGPGGTTNKSHRPSDAFALDATAINKPYDTSSAVTTQIYAVSATQAKQIFAAQPTAPLGGGTLPHLVYVNSGSRYDGNGIYVYADTHAKVKPVLSTLDCGNFQWGTHAWNQGGASVLCGATGLQVTTN